MKKRDKEFGRVMHDIQRHTTERTHKDESKIIPRKKKHKNKED